MNILAIHTLRGITFIVRLIRSGDRYGHNQTIYCGEPLVEFYDTRYPHTDLGQFVSSYYRSTLVKGAGGLQLDGGVPDWSIDYATMNRVRAWLETPPQLKGAIR